MTHTRWSNLSDVEFLSQVRDKAHLSPLISEFYSRLEQHNTGMVIDTDSGHRVECPVCEAPLFADYEPENTQFTLRVNDE